MNKKKILVLTQYFYPENFLINSLVELISDDIEVDVLCPYPSYPNASLFENNNWSDCEFLDGKFPHKINRIKSILRKGDGVIHLLLVSVSFILSATIWLLCNRRKYDAIFCHLPSPVLLGIAPIFAFRYEKKILWVLDLWPEAVIAKLKSSRIPKFIRSPFGFLIHYFVKIMYQKSNLLATHTSEMVKHLEAESSKKVFLFPQWGISILPNYDHPAIQITHDFCIDFKLNVVNAGNFGVHQDIDLLIDLTVACPSIGFVFLGDGSKWTDLAERVASNKSKNVLLIDRVSESVLMALISNFDVGLSTLQTGGGLSKILPRRVNLYMQAGLVLISHGTNNAFEGLDDLDTLRSSSDEPIHDLVYKLTALEEMSRENLEQLKYETKNFYNKNYSESEVINKFMKMLD